MVRDTTVVNHKHLDPLPFKVIYTNIGVLKLHRQSMILNLTLLDI